MNSPTLSQPFCTPLLLPIALVQPADFKPGHASASQPAMTGPLLVSVPPQTPPTSQAGVRMELRPLLKMSGGVPPRPLHRCRSHQADAVPFSTILAKGQGAPQPGVSSPLLRPAQPDFRYWEPTGGMVSPAEQGILSVRSLPRPVQRWQRCWNKAKDEFIDQLASSRIRAPAPG